MPTLPGCGGHSPCMANIPTPFFGKVSPPTVCRKGTMRWKWGGTLDLLALVEDELLLALPIVPAHDPEVCQHPGWIRRRRRAGVERSRDKRPNPFSVLAQLKRDPNV